MDGMTGMGQTRRSKRIGALDDVTAAVMLLGEK